MICALAMIHVPTSEMTVLKSWTKLPELPETLNVMRAKIQSMVDRPDWNHSDYVFTILQPNFQATSILRDSFIRILVDSYMGRPLPTDPILQTKRIRDTSEITTIMIEDLLKTEGGRDQLSHLEKIFPEIKELVDIIKSSPSVPKHKTLTEPTTFTAEEMSSTLDLINKAVGKVRKGLH